MEEHEKQDIADAGRGHLLPDTDAERWEFYNDPANREPATDEPGIRLSQYQRPLDEEKLRQWEEHFDRFDSDETTYAEKREEETDDEGS